MISEALDKMFDGSSSEEVAPEGVEAPQSIEQAPVTQEAQPQPQPTPEVPEQRAPEPTQPPPGFIPLAAVLDEREKRKELERELAQYRSQQAQPNQAPPSFYDDPEAFAAYQQEQFAGIERNIRFSTSERFAVQAHGSEVVEQAKEWSLSQSPYLIAQIRDSQDPIGEAVAQYQRSQMVADPDAWFAQEAAKRGYQQAASAGAVTPAAPFQQPARPAPPRSLASAPSAGRMTEPSNDAATGGLKFNLDR